MSNFIKIHLKDGIKDRIKDPMSSCYIALEYNEDGEVYFNKNQILSFNIDEKSCTINIHFAPMLSDYIIQSELVFPNKGGEFQRIKRELTE